MSAPIPILLLLAVAPPLLLGAADRRWQGRHRRLLGLCGAGCLAAGGLTTAVLLAAGSAPARLALPIGPPGMALSIDFDPLSGFFLLSVFLVAALASIFASESRERLDRIATIAAGLILTLLAADGAAALLGLLLAHAPVWLAADRSDRRLGVSLAAILCAMAAWMAPMADGGGLGAVMALLAIGGCGVVAGAIPLPVGGQVGAARLGPAAAALSFGAMPTIGLYLLLRLIGTTGDAAADPRWGAALVVAGGASAVAAAWSAAREQEIGDVVGALVRRHSGLCILAIGFAILARAGDLPNVAALSFGAALLLAVTQTVCGTLVILAAEVVAQGAGSRRLDRMGGLIHRMPIASLGLALGCAGLVAVPPFAGFACLWLLFQTILTAPRVGALWPDALLAVAAAGLAVSFALATSASLRLFGVAILGRPRTPRGAAADEVAPSARRPIVALAAVSVAIGILPDMILRFLADPAVGVLTGGAAASRSGILILTTSTAIAGYAPMEIAIPIGAIGIAVFRLSRRSADAPRPGPAWTDGFAPPPPWLPFGDPSTQTGGAGFAPEPPAVKSTLAMLSGWPIAASGPWLLLAAIAALLALLAWTGSA